MNSITVYSLCSDCEHFQFYDSIEDVYISECYLGRTKEFREDGGLTDCPYWKG